MFLFLYSLFKLNLSSATAYIGFNKCEPKKGEIVLVSGAAGAVGNVVGQLAKIQVKKKRLKDCFKIKYI